MIQKNKAVIIRQIKSWNLLKLFFLTIFIFTCENQNQNEENMIFYKNFDSLIDSTIIDRRRLVVPSPENFKDSMGQNQLNERLKKKNEVKLPPLIIVLRDSITAINDLDNKMMKFISETNYLSLINNCEKKEVYKVDVANFDLDESKYHLISYSEFEKKKELSDSIDVAYDLPIYSLSQICFNKKQNLGVFKMNIVYGRLDAHGVLVIVKKKKGSWVIDQIIEDWES